MSEEAEEPQTGLDDLLGGSGPRSPDVPACTRMHAWRLRPRWCSPWIALLGDPHAFFGASVSRKCGSLWVDVAVGRYGTV
jgi:hypothetical protein